MDIRKYLFLKINVTLKRWKFINCVFFIKAFQKLNQQLNSNIPKDTSKSKSFENLANSFKTENNSIVPDSSILSSTRKIEDSNNTHTFNRLVKIASNWQSKSRSSSTSSNYQQTKVIDRGLISQSKIRQTQKFINDSLEYANSESTLSRKLADDITHLNKYSNSDTDDFIGPFNRSKSLRVSNKTPNKLPNKLPMTSSESKPLEVDSNLMADSSKLEANEAYSNINYWKPNETTTNTIISEVGAVNELQSGRNSLLNSRKNSKSIEFLNFNQKAKLTSSKLLQKLNNAAKAETPQLNKFGNFAIETQ